MSWSVNRPGKCIRWSVAIEPVTAIFMSALEVGNGGLLLQQRTGTLRATGRPVDRDGLCCFSLRLRSAQWNESPQAQEFCAFGLSIVKPCASIRSAKSIVAPARYGELI